MNTTLPYNHHHAIHEKLDGYWTPESISALLALSPEDKQSIAVQSYTELVSQDVTLH